MEEDISELEEKIIKLKKRKEQLQTKKAILYLKESQNILDEKFSYELALSILSNSWKSSSDKQKEEWIKSAEPFRKLFTKRKPKEIANRASKPQSESSQSPAKSP